MQCNISFLFLFRFFSFSVLHLLLEPLHSIPIHTHTHTLTDKQGMRLIWEIVYFTFQLVQRKTENGWCSICNKHRAWKEWDLHKSHRIIIMDAFIFSKGIFFFFFRVCCVLLSCQIPADDFFGVAPRTQIGTPIARSEKHICYSNRQYCNKL